MFGAITRHAEVVGAPEFDRVHFEVKDAAGAQREPVPDAVNAVSCFGDTAAVREAPSLAAVDEAGRPATPDRPYFDWSHVCPSHEGYREGLLALIEACVEAAPDVRLDDVGFPRGEYCHCERCAAAFSASDATDRGEWRAATISSFVEAAAERVPGELSMAVHPDPYPGHLRRRSGIDLEAVEPLLEEVVVPLYDTAYGTTYWIEAIASAFADRLEVPLAVELYAAEVDLDALVRATRVAAEYADRVDFGYDAGQGRAVVRRLRAEERDGRSHGGD